MEGDSSINSNRNSCHSITWSATLTIPSGLTAIADIEVNLAVVDNRVSFELLVSLKHEHGEVLLPAQSHKLKKNKLELYSDKTKN